MLTCSQSKDPYRSKEVVFFQSRGTSCTLRGDPRVPESDNRSLEERKVNERSEPTDLCPN